MDILNEAATDQLREQDAEAFDGKPIRHVLTGPINLYRFAGSLTLAGKAADHPELGAWWFDIDMLDQLADDVTDAFYDGNRQSRRNVLAGHRTALAIKTRWSNMAWFCQLKLATNQGVMAWHGKALPQQDQGRGFWNGLLPGGGHQILIYGLDKISDLNMFKVPTQAFIERVIRQPSYRGF